MHTEAAFVKFIFACHFFKCRFTIFTYSLVYVQQIAAFLRIFLNACANIYIRQAIVVDVYY